MFPAEIFPKTELNRAGKIWDTITAYQPALIADWSKVKAVMCSRVLKGFDSRGTLPLRRRTFISPVDY